MTVGSVISPVIRNTLSGTSLGLWNGSSVPFPFSLFVGATAGFMWDPSNLASLYQDTAGTTPITAASDPVGRVNDLSGFGYNALQGTAANRPVYTIDGSGKPCLLFDGVNDSLAAAATAALPLPYFLACGVDRISTTTAQGFVAYGVNATNLFNITASSTLERVTYIQGATGPGSIAPNSANNAAPAGKHYLDFYSIPGTTDYLIDNQSKVSTANSWTSSTTMTGSTTFRLNRVSTAIAENHRCYFALGVVGRVITDDERAQLRAFINSKMGV